MKQNLYCYKGQIITASCKEEAIAQIVEAGILDKIKEKLSKVSTNMLIKGLNKVRNNEEAKKKILELCDLAAKKIPAKKDIFLKFKKKFASGNLSVSTANAHTVVAKERLLTSEEMRRMREYEGTFSDNPVINEFIKWLGIPTGGLFGFLMIITKLIEAGIIS
jgi:hypothetical protein